MTKAELIEKVAAATNLTKKETEEIIETILEGITNGLKDHGKVELRGFGSFRVRNRRAREGRNPQTGQPVQVPPKRIPYFKPGKELKALVNG